MTKTKVALDELERRSYKSYRARLESKKRLSRTGHWWNAAQFSLSLALIAVSVLFLAYPAQERIFAAAMLVILAVLSLVVSIVVTYLSYAKRAQAMFQNYRALQAFSVKLETLKTTGQFVAVTELHRLQEEYNNLLDASENHTSIDHELAQVSQLPFSLLVQITIPVILPLLLILGSIITIGLGVIIVQ